MTGAVVGTPVGGGGLLSGTAIAVRGLAPQTQVIAAEPAGENAAQNSCCFGFSASYKSSSSGMLSLVIRTRYFQSGPNPLDQPLKKSLTSPCLPLRLFSFTLLLVKSICPAKDFPVDIPKIIAIVVGTVLGEFNTKAMKRTFM